jgi:potassium-transporting ATPase potassium-binding subunit
MVTNILISVLIFLVAAALALLTGRYMSKVYKGEKSILDFIQPVEKFIFRICRINPTSEMNWKQYLLAILIISMVWLVIAFVVLVFQGSLFFNPAGNPSMEWTLALNSAISFLTSTNLQHYSGETGATYLSQVGIFMFLQFVSAATSLAVGVAVVRGFVSGSSKSLGNFYSDFIKSITRILLPLCIITAIFFLVSGMPMTFEGPQKISTLQGDSVTVATGPVASFIPIKELGSKGGGFFGANDAHPFENTSFFTFIIHSVIVFLLPMAFVFMIGYYLRQKKFSNMIFGVMTAGFLLVTILIIYQEVSGNPLVHAMGINTMAGNMEGKEVRFGSFYSAFYCGENVSIPAGTVAGMHDSFMPLSGIAMLTAMNIDAFFGGLGTGWINIFIFLIVAVFIGTWMIGRTPELMGKKINAAEMKLAVGVLVLQTLIPVAMAAIACFVYVNYAGGNNSLGWLSNHGPHGFTTMLYEYISSAAANGSGFEGLGDNTAFWNLTTAVAMIFGRFVPVIGALIIAGRLKEKKYTPLSTGSLKTDSITFGVFLLMVLIVLNALSMFISLMLGPISDFFILN